MKSIVKDFPDPYEFIVGFNCYSTLEQRRSNTGTSSSLGVSHCTNKPTSSSPIGKYSGSENVAPRNWPKTS
jgi:hypothetical protein